MLYTYASLKARFTECPIIPVMAVSHVDAAIEIACALLAGGISHMEILVRGDEEQQGIAIAAIAAIRHDTRTSTMVVGAGTINEPEKMRRAVEAGACFLVSADSAVSMLRYWKEHHATVPYYPTGFTTTEIKEVVDAGAEGVKLFPKNQLLQPDLYLRSIGNIYGSRCHVLLSYDATHPQNIDDLKYPVVAGIAAGWLVPAFAVEKCQWDIITRITQCALEAIALHREKAFSLLQGKINEICELAAIEPVKKDMATQTSGSPCKLSPVLAAGVGLFAVGAVLALKKSSAGAAPVTAPSRCFLM